MRRMAPTHPATADVIGSTQADVQEGDHVNGDNDVEKLLGPDAFASEAHCSHKEECWQSSGSLPYTKCLALDMTEILAAFAVVLYGGTAISMGFINKAVLSTYHFRESNVLLLLQQVSALFVVKVLSSFGVVLPDPLSFTVARKLLLVSFLYNANVAFALASLASLNIPMYMALKRLTPAFVLVANCWRGKSRPSRRVAASVLTIVLGCWIAGIGDMSFDLKGYLFAFISCFLQSAYLLIVEHTGVENGISSITMLRYNAWLSLAPLALLTYLTGEAKSTAATLAKVQDDTGFWVTFVAALGFGLLLNYSLFLCTELNSAQTTTVVGALKGVVTTALGFVLLGGVGPTSPLNIIGILMNAAGGVWYSYIKWFEKSRIKVPAHTGESDNGTTASA